MLLVFFFVNLCKKYRLLSFSSVSLVFVGNLGKSVNYCPLWWNYLFLLELLVAEVEVPSSVR